jgi:PadR family transcriptional regulator, regulatory protein PadR
VSHETDILAASNHANWLSQVKRGVLELCILNLLARQPLYGYLIVKRVTAIPGLVLSEGTIYPLLSRLKGQGLLVSELVESPQGPARRTYVLTEAGKRYLGMINHAWEDVVGAVERCSKEIAPERESAK